MNELPAVADSLAKHFRVVLNQNLWGLVVGFSGLGFAEKSGLCWLRVLAALVSVGMMVSLAFTTIAYTKHYWRKKMKVA